MNPKSLRIIEKVSHLYQRYGIKSVTMDDVAGHLCISKKTLYEYFKDKEELVRHVMLRQYEKHNQYLREIAKMKLNAVEELLEVCKMIHIMYRDYNPSMEYDIRKYYPDLFSSIKMTWRERMFKAAFNNMNKGKKEGLYRKEIDSDILARMHVFRMEKMFESDLFTMEELSSFRVFHELFVFHLYGILSDKGRKFFEMNFKKFRSDLA